MVQNPTLTKKKLPRFLRVRWLGIVLVFVVGVVVVARIQSFTHPEPSGNCEITSVPHTLSKGNVFLNVTANGSAGIQLVWKSKELSGVQFQNSVDSGKTWSEPIAIQHTESAQEQAQPVVTVNGKNVSVFWLERGIKKVTSSDNGFSWGEAEAVTPVSQLVKSFALTQDGDRSYLVFTTLDGVYIQESSDAAESWSQDQLLMTLSGPLAIDVAPSISVHNSNVYVLWKVRSENKNDAASTAEDNLWLAISRTGGAHFGPPADIAPKRSEAQGATYHSIIQAGVVATDSVVAVFYERDGLQTIRSSDSGVSWSPPDVISAYPTENLVVTNSSSAVYLAWIDSRYRRQEWWSRIPGHQLLAWDRDPNWANNDVILTPIDRVGMAGLQQLLTPLLSWAETLPGQMSMSASDGSVFLVWSGASRVGKTVAVDAQRQILFANCRRPR